MPTIAVGGTWWAYATGDGVGQGGEVKSGADVAGQARHRGHGLGVDAFRQGGPDVAATGRTGLAHKGVQPCVIEQARDDLGIASCRVGCTGRLGVEVEAEELETSIRVGQIDRPGTVWLVGVDTAMAGVFIEDLAIGVHRCQAHAGAWADGSGKFPWRASRGGMELCSSRRYDGISLSVRSDRYNEGPGFASRFFISPDLICLPNFQQIRRYASESPPGQGRGFVF